MHSAIEAWEQSRRTLAEADVQRTYEERWAEELQKGRDVESDLDRWLTGNSRVKGSVDVDRRHGRGWAQVEAYQAMALEADWDLWETPDGDVAVELPFTITLSGVDVLGYIDQVREWPDGSLEVVDLKTGSKRPDWGFQLGVYRLAILDMYGEDADTGSFLMLKDGKHTQREDLTGFTRERVSVWFENMNRGVDSEVFMPNVADHCRICGVWSWCPAKKAERGYR